MKKAERIQRAIDLLTEEGYQVIPPSPSSIEDVTETAIVQPVAPAEDDYPLKEALSVWLDYKREKKQNYKPIGLKCVKKKLLQLSGGDPSLAMEIVEGCMANNYTGLFPLNRTNHNGQLTKQEAIRRVAQSVSTNDSGTEPFTMENSIPKPF